MSTQKLEDNAISVFLNKKDLKSFREFYHKLYKPLCSYLSGYLNNPSIVEDVVQESFVAIWEKRHSLNKGMNLSAYMYSMVRNKGLNAIRNKTREVFMEEETHGHPIEEDESLRIVKAEVYAEIMTRIEELPKRAREVFKLSTFSRLPDAEIAEQMSISINSVKTHKKRARAALRSRLKNTSFALLILISSGIC